MNMNMNRCGWTGLIAGSMLLAGTALAVDVKESKARVVEKARDASKSVGENLDEAILGSKVRMSLLKSLKGADALRITVAVRGTAATLTGEVEDRASIKVASEAAKSVEGVGAVYSSITHNTKAPRQENFESRLKDEMLVTQVRLGLLQELGASAVGISVTATDGVVSMRGKMLNETTHDRAVDKVKGMTDVKRIEDLTTTTP